MITISSCFMPIFHVIRAAVNTQADKKCHNLTSPIVTQRRRPRRGTEARVCRYRWLTGLTREPARALRQQAVHVVAEDPERVIGGALAEQDAGPETG
jgi:hypothetical protein